MIAFMMGGDPAQGACMALPPTLEAWRGLSLEPWSGPSLELWMGSSFLRLSRGPSLGHWMALSIGPGAAPPQSIDGSLEPRYDTEKLSVSH